MKEFCEECREYETYRVEEIKRIKKIRNREITFNEKVAYCTECDSEIFVSKLRDDNLYAMDKAYRLSEGLITIAQIKKILDKYSIGKRPLSILLGWGETTLTRFVNGDIPTKVYSDFLIRIDESPKEYFNLLIQNRSKITDSAYKKSFDAVDSIINKAKICNPDTKIESACNYIISHSKEITPLALQKLLYFTQAFYRVFAGCFMFSEDCEAWVHGPVYRDIYFKYKDQGYNPIEDDENQFKCFNLTIKEREILDSVINNFGCYSGKILEAMTHIEPPWKETRAELCIEEVSNRVIHKDIIERYFTKVYQKYNMINIADIKDYSESLFDKVRY